jgi:hypothetical protein
MNMISSLPGLGISPSPVTNIDAHGFWLLVDDAEYFVPFADYPVFATATVEQIFAVQPLGPRQFHWPELDVDVELDALETPERYPLVWR